MYLGGSVLLNIVSYNHDYVCVVGRHHFGVKSTCNASNFKLSNKIYIKNSKRTLLPTWNKYITLEDFRNKKI